jgi:serine protease SohB
MEYIYNYILFLFQAVTIVASIIAVLVYIVSLKKGNKAKGSIKVEDLTEKYEDYTDDLEDYIYSEEYLKDKDKKEAEKEKKDKKAAKKSKNKNKKIATGRKPTIFVIDFVGSVMADEVDSLREEISAILLVANKDDEVVVNIESPGGAVHGYGLAASQLDRIKQKGIKLTVCVDKVAASGGYLMACVADKIIAAPFSIIGSIGVVMQMPNIHKVLKKYDVDYEQITAGAYKRTLTTFGENTDEARTKVKEELEDIHNIFKSFILKYRPQVDLDKVATGEHWLASQALDLKLVDEIKTSDEYIQDSLKDKKVLSVEFKVPESLSKKLTKDLSLGLESSFDKFFNKKQTPMS